MLTQNPWSEAENRELRSGSYPWQKRWNARTVVSGLAADDIVTRTDPRLVRGTVTGGYYLLEVVLAQLSGIAGWLRSRRSLSHPSRRTPVCRRPEVTSGAAPKREMVARDDPGRWWTASKCCRGRSRPTAPWGWTRGRLEQRGLLEGLIPRTTGTDRRPAPRSTIAEGARDAHAGPVVDTSCASRDASAVGSRDCRVWTV